MWWIAYSCGIQNNGAPGAPDGVWIVQGNQITQSGYTEGRYSSANPNDGPGRGIYAGSLHDVQVSENDNSLIYNEALMTRTSVLKTRNSVFKMIILQIIGNSITGGFGDGIFGCVLCIRSKNKIK